MTAEQILERLQAQFPAAVAGSNLGALDPWIELKGDFLPDVCRFLRDDAELQFNMLHLITCVDHFQPDEKLAAKAAWQPHLEVLYHLSSLALRHRIVLKVLLPRWQDDVPGRLPELPSVCDIWRTAEWHEREVYDLCGVGFPGNPDLRRILCPDDWVGHPLRKDYVMPEEYHGIRAR